MTRAALAARQTVGDPQRLLVEKHKGTGPAVTVTVRSVANLTRQDAEEFLALAPRVPIRARVEVFSLNDVNLAVAALRDGRLEGSAVIDITL